MTNAAESTGEGSRARWSGHSVRPADILGIGAVTGYGWGTQAPVGRVPARGECGPAHARDSTGSWRRRRLPLHHRRRRGPPRRPEPLHAVAPSAAREAIADARERGWSRARSSGWCTASSRGRRDVERVLRSGKRVRPKTWVNMMPSTVLAQLMKENDFHGPTMSVSAMCATGNAGDDHGQVVARHRALHPTSSCWPPTCRCMPPGPAWVRPTSVPPCSTCPPSRPAARSRRGAGASSGARPRWPWCSPGGHRLLRVGARWGHDHGRLPIRSASPRT